MQVALGDLADARDLAHLKRSQEAGLLSRRDPQDAMRLGLIGSDFCNQPRTGRANRAVQIRRAVHGIVKRVRGRERLTVQLFRARHIEIGFVD